MPGLWFRLGLAAVGLGLGACSSSTTIVTQAAPPTSQTSPSPPPTSAAGDACFDGQRIQRLGKEWKKVSTDLNQLRTADRAIALELALATSADPDVSDHFQEAADAYAKAPEAGPNVSPAELSRAFDAMGDGADAMNAGVKALSDSSIPFCS
jgi:hypothetical protein